MVPRNGHKGGRREKKELQGYQSSLGSDGFENQFRVGALGADAFELGRVMIRKIHAYLVKEVNLAESAEEKAAEFVNRHILFTNSAVFPQFFRPGSPWKPSGLRRGRGKKALNGLIACWKDWEPDGPRTSWRKSTQNSLNI